MQINSRGYWENETAEGHEHDEGLAKALVEFLKKQSKTRPVLLVMDVGCGDGFYTNYINQNSNNEIMCWGIDGNPNTVKLAGSTTSIADLTKPLSWHVSDWVLCLEVGEHIPSTFEATFLQNLDKLNRYGIILSWAIPGQGGDGHVNCQNNQDIINKMEALGFVFRVEETKDLREQCGTYPNPCYWFRDTLMVFRRVGMVCSRGYDMAE